MVGTAVVVGTVVVATVVVVVGATVVVVDAMVVVVVVATVVVVVGATVVGIAALQTKALYSRTQRNSQCHAILASRQWLTAWRGTASDGTRQHRRRCLQGCSTGRMGVAG